jgi:hypothetical protein
MVRNRTLRHNVTAKQVMLHHLQSTMSDLGQTKEQETMETNTIGKNQFAQLVAKKWMAGAAALLLSGSLLAGCTPPAGDTGVDPAATPIIEQDEIPTPETAEETDILTDTEGLEDGDVLTDTEDVTDTEGMTDTEGVTDTEGMTDTEGLTDTEGVTDTEELTDTETVTN